ncbi:MAG: Asp-tRNA(Asn)/Glu-tRNA(Gln) amidotransferase subunit GatB [Firmicutes bacterium]|nr:Asp-tRNA(Asn)/Glu-tRNA(Gln) amidotransferase subunit GatB [Bacillota bacterium]
MSYEIVIGLEIHCELKTKTKAFCSCRNEFGAEPNVNVCPGCLGMPGTLPALNKTAVEYCIRAGLAVGCKISRYSAFERKHYFYPDLPNAYQVSQLEYPLCIGGGLTLDSGKFVRLNRIHLEEDAGKLLHGPYGTRVDLNRAGVPLIEIVTEPDLRSADEAVEFLAKLKSALLTTGVSDCKMQEGRLRCDVNVSVNKPGDKWGTRIEMKNLASFSAIKRAITYEAKRQMDELDKGNTFVQATRRWDDKDGKSYPMRDKETSNDYRYFPDANIIPINVEPSYVESIRKTLPEMPWELKERLQKELGLSEYDARTITSDKAYSDLYLNVLKTFNEPKFVLNFIMGEVFKKLNALGQDDIEIPLKPEILAKLLKLYHGKTIAQATARELLDEIWESNADPEQIVKDRNLAQVSDSGALEAILQKLVADNPKAAEQLKMGDPKVNQFFIGQTMKATGGKANPAVVLEVLNKIINK